MIVILTLARLRSWLNHDGRCRAAGAESTDPVWEVGAGVADPSQVRPDAEALLGHYQEAEGRFNRSSQHRLVPSRVCVRSKPLWVFSSQGFCVVGC